MSTSTLPHSVSTVSASELVLMNESGRGALFGQVSARQSGRTTEQMKAAPVGAVYVWCNTRLQYPKGLAESIGRGDLEVRPPSWLSYGNVRDLLPRIIVLDHAIEPGRDEWAALSYLSGIRGADGRPVVCWGVWGQEGWPSGISAQRP